MTPRIRATSSSRSKTTCGSTHSAEDPNHRDPLADPTAAVVPGRVTLNAQGPVRGH